jgi:hypothetical protein
MNSVAVNWNGIMNQGACKLIAINTINIYIYTNIVSIVFANMIGILLIVIVGLALTKPLATGNFVVIKIS